MLIRVNILFLFVPDFNNLARLSPRCIAPEAKHHIQCAFKEANISFPAHSRFTMPESAKLLLHFTPTVWADLVILAFLLIVQTVLVQQKVIDTHN